MAEQWWIEVVKQVPSLVVLSWLVVVFLKHMKEDRHHRERAEERSAETLKSIGTSCHTFQRELTAKNHEVMVKTHGALEKNADALSKATYWLDRQQKRLQQ